MAYPVRTAVRRPIRPVRPPSRTATRAKPATPAAPAAPTPPTTDFSSDPVLLQIRAMSARNLAGAEAAATAARTQALERYGYDPSLDYGDANVAGVAKANPNSVLATLARANEQRQRGITNTRNSQNLFYSSTYGNDLAQNAQAYQGEQQSAAERLRDLLGGITQSLAGAHQGEDERVAQAEQDAYLRALQFSLQYPGAAPAQPARTAAPAARRVSALRTSLLRRVQ